MNREVHVLVLREAGGATPPADSPGSRRIGDIGGGRGHLLRAVLESVPDAAGVLFDLPQVVAREAAMASDRVSVQPGDFFQDELPVCDTYLMMNVIHDWADAEAVKILRAVRKSAPMDARLLLIESILPETTGAHPVRNDPILNLDVAMLAITGGRERTLAEYQALLAAAGFRLDRAVETDTSIAILEGTPK